MQIDNAEEVKKVLQDFELMFLTIYDKKKELENQIMTKEMETQDYLHELELAKLNGIEIMKVANSLIKTRRERRELKDKLELINTVKAYIDDHITKGMRGEVQQTIKNIEMLEKNQQNRSYVPRVIKNLKCVKKENQICNKIKNT